MIVFIVVAAVVMPVIISPVLTLLKDSTKPEKAVTANFLAQQKLETITKNNYTSITIEEVAYAPVTDFTNYQWYWKTEWVDSSLATPDPLADNGYIKITVKVKDPYNTEYIYYTLAT